MTNQDYSNRELLSQLKEFIKEEIRENREEIIKENNKILNQLQTNTKRLDTLENKYNALELRCIQLDRIQRKNNIIIFGLQSSPQNLLNFVIDKLEQLLEIKINKHYINNIYQLKGKNPNPIKLEFTSNLVKQEIVKNSKKLKGTNISIVHDLCLEDREDNKVLYSHLKAARANNQRARIKGKTLEVEEDIYTIQQLKKFDVIEEEPSKPSQEGFKINSTPSTPASSEITEFRYPDRNQIEEHHRRTSEQRPHTSPLAIEEDARKTLKLLGNCLASSRNEVRITRSSNKPKTAPNLELQK